MPWTEAWKALKAGHKVKREKWDGFWVWDNNTIMIHEANGNIINILDTEDPAYTFSNMAANDWIIVYV